ncbi:MAG: hypothetical protein ABJL99_27110 [Aliishimia sp.]
MKDDFESYTTSLTSPARDADPITPDDATDLNAVTRGIFVGASGNLQVQMLSGQTVTFNNVQAGVVYPLRVARVLATGTTAAGLIALQ